MASKYSTIHHNRMNVFYFLVSNSKLFLKYFEKSVDFLNYEVKCVENKNIFDLFGKFKDSINFEDYFVNVYPEFLLVLEHLDLLYNGNNSVPFSSNIDYLLEISGITKFVPIVDFTNPNIVIVENYSFSKGNKEKTIFKFEDQRFENNVFILAKNKHFQSFIYCNAAKRENVESGQLADFSKFILKQ